MWSLLLLRWRVGLTLGAAGIIASSMEAFGFGPNATSHMVGKVALFLSPLGMTAALGWLLGAWKPAWTLVSNVGMKHWFPNLNGVWEGEFRSSRQRTHPDTPNRLVLRIDQKWGKVSIYNDAASGSTDSIPILCIPAQHHGQPCLYVFYEAWPKASADSDSENFLGAERIIYNSERDSLIGDYMTNRAWMRGNNTAGRFELTRQPKEKI